MVKATGAVPATTIGGDPLATAGAGFSIWILTVAVTPVTALCALISTGLGGAARGAV